MITFLNDLLTGRRCRSRPSEGRHNQFVRYKNMYALAAANRSCSRRDKNTHTLAAAKNVAVTSRWIFSFTFCGGAARCAHVGGITFGLLQPSIFIKWSNFVARFARVYAHPVTPGARARGTAAVVYYPNCIIALCLRGYNVSRCICHGAPRLVHARSNGLIALSTQLRNCLQFTISRPGLAHASRSILRTFARSSSFFQLFASVHKSAPRRSCDKRILI